MSYFKHFVGDQISVGDFFVQRFQIMLGFIDLLSLLIGAEFDLTVVEGADNEAVENLLEFLEGIDQGSIFIKLN